MSESPDQDSSIDQAPAVMMRLQQMQQEIDSLRSQMQQASPPPTQSAPPAQNEPSAPTDIDDPMIQQMVSEMLSPPKGDAWSHAGAEMFQNDGESKTPEQRAVANPVNAPDLHQAVSTLTIRVEDLESKIRGKPEFPEYGIVEITASDSNATYATKEKYVTSAGLVDYVDGRVSGAVSTFSAAKEVNGWKWIPNGQKAFFLAYDNGGDTRYAIVVPVPPPPSDSGTDYALTYNGSTKKMEWSQIDDCA